MKGMIHTCTVRGKRQNFTLAYDSGTAAFTAGKTLTGATSHATAIIVSTGAVGSGTLTLHTISGTFQNNEVISDNGTIPGAALADGTIADAMDGYGQITFTDIDSTSVICHFYRSEDSARVSGQALYMESKVRVMLPLTVTSVAPGDNIVSTVTGFVGTWNVTSVAPLPGPGGTRHHWECDLALGGA
jgi:hypothetical protein